MSGFSFGSSGFGQPQQQQPQPFGGGGGFGTTNTNAPPYGGSGSSTFGGGGGFGNANPPAPAGSVPFGGGASNFSSDVSGFGGSNPPAGNSGFGVSSGFGSSAGSNGFGSGGMAPPSSGFFASANANTGMTNNSSGFGGTGEGNSTSFGSSVPVSNSGFGTAGNNLPSSGLGVSSAGFGSGFDAVNAAPASGFGTAASPPAPNTFGGGARAAPAPTFGQNPPQSFPSSTGGFGSTVSGNSFGNSGTSGSLFASPSPTTGASTFGTPSAGSNPFGRSATTSTTATNSWGSGGNSSGFGSSTFATSSTSGFLPTSGNGGSATQQTPSGFGSSGFAGSITSAPSAPLSFGSSSTVVASVPLSGFTSPSTGGAAAGLFSPSLTPTHADGESSKSIGFGSSVTPSESSGFGSSTPFGSGVGSMSPFGNNANQPGYEDNENENNSQNEANWSSSPFGGPRIPRKEKTPTAKSESDQPEVRDGLGSSTSTRNSADAKGEDQLALLRAKLQEKKKRLTQLKQKDNATLDKGTEAKAKVSAAPLSSSSSSSNSPPANSNNEDLAAKNALRFAPSNSQQEQALTKLLPDDLKARVGQQSQTTERIPLSGNNSGESSAGDGFDDGDDDDLNIRNLSSAKSLIGTCKNMCPDEELLRREREGDIQLLEITDPGGLHPEHWTLRDTAVKRFRRSAADFKLDIPELVRPPEVLERVCGYLEEWVMERDRQGPDYRFAQQPSIVPPPLDVYQFIWDRTRMIRKDFILQNYIGNGGKCDARAVRCHERIARWHAMCEHQLSHIPDFVQHQSQQNIAELGQTMKTLNLYYDDALGRSTLEVASEEKLDHNQGCSSDIVMGKSPIDFDGSALSNATDGDDVSKRLIGKHGMKSPTRGTAEPEMRGLYILLTMNNEGGMEVLKYSGRLCVQRPDVFYSRPVQLALSVFQSKKEHNYARFFKILRSPATPYLYACIMFKYVEHMRKDALMIMSKTYGAKHKTTGEPFFDSYPLENLVELLCYENEEEAREACLHYGITVQDDQVLWRHSKFCEPHDPVKNTIIQLKPRKMIRTIECKLRVGNDGFVTRLSVCRGAVSGEGATLSKSGDLQSPSLLTAPITSDADRKMAKDAAEQARQEAVEMEKARQKQKAENLLAEKERFEQMEKEKLKAKQLEAERKRKAMLEEKHRAEEERIKRERQLEEARRERERIEQEKRKREQEEEKRRLALEREEARKRAEAEERERERRMREELERRKLEEEVLRQKKEREAAEKRKRLEEERARREEEERRMEQERQRKAEEDRLRKEKEEKEHQIEMMWRQKIERARKIMIWQLWRKRMRRYDCSENSTDRLVRLDPTRTHYPSPLNRINSAFAAQTSSLAEEHMELEGLIYRYATATKMPLNLAQVFSKCNFHGLKKYSNHSPLYSFAPVVSSSRQLLLFKIAICLPELTTVSKTLYQSLVMWVNTHLQIGNICSYFHETTSGQIEVRSVAVIGNEDRAFCCDCDAALFLLPSKLQSSELIFPIGVLNSLGCNTLRMILLLDVDESGDSRYFDNEVINSILGEENSVDADRSRPGVVSPKPDSFDVAFRTCCESLAQSHLESTINQVVSDRVSHIFARVSLPNLGFLCLQRLIQNMDGMGMFRSRNIPNHLLFASCKNALESLVNELSYVGKDIRGDNVAHWPPNEFFSGETRSVRAFFDGQFELPEGWCHVLLDTSNLRENTTSFFDQILNIDLFPGFIENFSQLLPTPKGQNLIAFLDHGDFQLCIANVVESIVHGEVLTEGIDGESMLYLPMDQLARVIENSATFEAPKVPILPEISAEAKRYLNSVPIAREGPDVEAVENAQQTHFTPDLLSSKRKSQESNIVEVEDTARNEMTKRSRIEDCRASRAKIDTNEEMKSKKFTALLESFLNG